MNMELGFRCDWCGHITVCTNHNRKGYFRCENCGTVMNIHTAALGYRL